MFNRTPKATLYDSISLQLRAKLLFRLISITSVVKLTDAPTLSELVIKTLEN